MAFVNEFVTQENRDKYFSKYEILEKYYPRDWTIDRERERERKYFISSLSWERGYVFWWTRT